MFGYVKADKPNMLMKDYAVYRAYYCGLCKTLGKRYNQLLRFTINYDITFLTIIAHNYRKLTPVFREERCVAHPVGKRFSVAKNDEVQEIVADINIILGYYKLEDDIADGGGLKYKVPRSYLKRMFRKAKARCGNVADTVKKHYAELRALESAKERNLDKLSDCFSAIMVEIGGYAAGKTDDNLKELCYNLGRWIYIIDAYDDLEKDYEKNRFNPLNSENAEISAELKEEIKETARFNLLLAVNNIRAAYDAMDITVTEGALSNIIYCGLMARTDEILQKGENNGKKPV